MTARNQIGVRLMRVTLWAALAAVVGWIAVKLTVGMLLARHVNSNHHAVLVQVWMTGCAVAGMLFGVIYDRRWLNERFRWICWGAVAGLLALLLFKEFLELLYPLRKEDGRIVMAGIAVQFEDLALVSAPGALFAGGFLGWFFQGRFGKTDFRPIDEITFPSTTKE